MRITTRIPCLTLVIAAAVVSGCATYPFGMSQAEWNELTPQQQVEYRRLDDRKARRDLIESEQTRREVDETIKQVESRLPRMPD